MPYQEMAPNSVPAGDQMYADMGGDASKLNKQMMPNTRMNDYITNAYAGPGSKQGPAKVKGKSEHIAEEDEFGSDYGV